MSPPTVVTLGRPGPSWARAVARWAAGGTVPVDLTTCVSAEELRAVVEQRAVDAALVELGMPGVDRVLADAVRHCGTALVAVRSAGSDLALEALAPDGVLDADLEPEALQAALRAHTRTRPAPPDGPDPAARSGPSGRLVAVTGPGGAGASTIAQALASQRAGDERVLLADLALDADQGLRHGLDPRADGLFELVEAVRSRSPGAVRPPLTPVGTGYALLPGLRRRQEWTILAGSTVDALLHVLRRDHDLVLADVSPDLDGRRECGSIDVEERNALARATTASADVVLVVGRPTTSGVHRLIRTVLELLRHGVPGPRVVPVLNGTSRRARHRDPAAPACRRLLEAAAPDARIGAPLTVAWERGVEAAVRGAGPLPRRLVQAAGRLPVAAP